MAIVAFLVIVPLLVRGCLASAADDRLRDYNRGVARIVGDSDRLVGRPFFARLRQGGEPVDLESDINQLAVTAQRHVQDAEDLEVPDALRPAQRNLLLALDLRETGLRKVAAKVSTAFARSDDEDDAAGAITGIAGDMQAFLASDVVYDARVVPFIGQELADEDIGGQGTYPGQFLPALGWLSPEGVGEQLGRQAAGAGGTRRRGRPAPGRHGHALTSVSVGETTLEPGEAVNEVPASGDIAFAVALANQGDNEEVEVPVRVRVRGDGTPTLSAERVVARTAAGAQTEATVPLTDAPPIGQPVEVEVTVEQVPGEELTENNTQTYTVRFTR